MKKQTLHILHRYRKHLLEREQAAIQDRLADENMQKVRLLELQARVAETHRAKQRSTSGAELVALDQAAAYLHTRITLAQRALALARQAREDAVARTLQLKQERDQVGHMLENDRRQLLRAQDDAERVQLDDLATARHALTVGAL